MTLLLDPPTVAAVDAPAVDTIATRAVQTSPAVATTPLVVYGDFNCPWSYLAFRRTRVLADHGIDVEWRAVEHDPRSPRRGRPARLVDLQDELDRVLTALIPGEELPYDLTGFVPSTAAAVTAYAEGRVSGVGARLATVIFESFWMHGIDIGNPAVLRTVLVDQLRGSASPSEAVREWGYPCDVTGGPISTAAWRLSVGWSSEWHAAERDVVPMVARSDGATIHGVDAVHWLGDVVASLTGSPTPAPLPDLPRPTVADRREVPDLGWVTAVGTPWHDRFRRVAS